MTALMFRSGFRRALNMVTLEHLREPGLANRALIFSRQKS